MNIRSGFVAVTVFVGFSAMGIAGTAEGVKALENKDYATAVRELKAGVDRGDADAEFNLGLMYGHGIGVERDIAEAWRLYQLAAEQGHAQAQFRLGLRSEHGWGVQQNFLEASQWYQRAADQGDVHAENGIAALYEDG
jgi:uncharacterized protein